MAFTRAFRSFIGRCMVGALLLSQFAVAAYACPQPVDGPTKAPAHATSHAVRAARASDTSAPAPCDSMDPAQKSLCAAHCHPSTPSADTASPPAPVAAQPPLLYALPALAPADVHAAVASGTAPDAPSLGAAPPSPHAIVHCVWRI